MPAGTRLFSALVFMLGVLHVSKYSSDCTRIGTLTT